MMEIPFVRHRDRNGMQSALDERGRGERGIFSSWKASAISLDYPKLHKTSRERFYP
jgi:hypothetical protein